MIFEVMNKKNVILTVATLLLMVVIVCEACIYFGYDLYSSDNGVFIRKRAYIATYENMSESELRQKVATGDADAIAQLAVYLYQQKGVRDKVILELAQKSADQNCARGKNFLGVLYATGEIVPQNYKKALSLYRDAVDGKCYSAWISIGDFYFNGIEVPKDPKEGVKCIEKAKITRIA